MTEPYESLANAIVSLAAKDYRDVLTKLKKRPRYEPAQIMKDEIERFFRSEWFKTLTSVDGDFLIKRLQMEVNNR